MSNKGVLQECNLSVSTQGVSQVGSLENVRNRYRLCSSTYVSAFGFVGFILIFWENKGWDSSKQFAARVICFRKLEVSGFQCSQYSKAQAHPYTTLLVRSPRSCTWEPPPEPHRCPTPKSNPWYKTKEFRRQKWAVCLMSLTKLFTVIRKIWQVWSFVYSLFEKLGPNLQSLISLAHGDSEHSTPWPVFGLYKLKNPVVTKTDKGAWSLISGWKGLMDCRDCQDSLDSRHFHASGLSNPEAWKHEKAHFNGFSIWIIDDYWLLHSFHMETSVVTKRPCAKLQPFWKARQNGAVVCSQTSWICSNVADQTSHVSKLWGFFISSFELGHCTRTIATVFSKSMRKMSSIQAFTSCLPYHVVSVCFQEDQAEASLFSLQEEGFWR